MPLLGFGVTFVGYSIFYYGLTQVRGGNWGLLQLMIPGKFDATVPNDSTGNGAGNAPQGDVAGEAPAVAQTGPGQGITSGSPGAGITQTQPGPLD